MSPELEARIYQDVLKAVLWGEAQEKILQMLQVNGITGYAANDMVARARFERTAEIRGQGMRKGVKGIATFFSGVVLIWAFWFSIGVLPRLVFIIVAFQFILGAYWILDGILTFLFAASRKGPIVSEE